MLNLKKVIALVCVFALTLTTVAFGATYTDVAEDSAYYEAVETLNKLDIITGYEDGTFKPEDGVTRAEMAALIARIQGYGETAKASANTAFTDVPASHWASGYIANAAGMGIINGYGDGTFGPEDPVLYEQAVKMIMATLGYTPFAEKNGGYPTGYLAAAQRYDVSLAVANAAVGSQANRGTVAQLLVNAIDTPLMIQARWSTDGTVDYVIADGNTTGYPYQTLMSANLGYVKLRGVVTANALVALGTGKTINTEADEEVSIRIDDKYDTINKDFDAVTEGTTVLDFLVGETDVADYIGRSVIIYVKKVADEYEVVSVAVDTNRNDELVIALDQYDTFDGTEIDYYKDGANTTTGAKIAASAPVIFNNDGNYTVANLNGMINRLNGGNITLIDNNDVKGYDVAIVKMAATGVVDEVGTKAIALKSAASLAGGSMSKINLNIDETKVVTILKDGAEIDAAELNEWDVLSIYAITKNSDYIVAEVVANQVVGTITSKKNSTTSAGGTAYKIADAWYDVANGVYDEGMDINEGGTFYIDEFGKIAAFVEDAALAGGAAANYAFVAGIKVDEADFGSGNSVVVKVQLVTADGVAVYTLRNNAVICQTGDAEATPALINTLDIDTWTDTNSDGTPENDGGDWSVVSGLNNEVVQYVKNSNGYITKIVEAGHKATTAGEANFANIISSDTATTYDAENVRLTGAGYVEEDAIVVIWDSSEAANCKLGTLADLADQNSYTVKKSYKDKKADYTNIIVVPYSEVAATSKTDAIAVIAEVGDATNDDGEAIKSISYFQDGELKTVNTAPDAVDGAGGLADINNLTPGDIVKIKLDSAGNAVMVDTVWNFTAAIRETDTDAFTGTAATDNVLGAADTTLLGNNSTLGEAFYGGYVTSFAKNSKLATIDDGTYSKSDIKLTNAENVYVIDYTGRNLYIDTASAGDFEFHEALYGGGTVTITDAEGKAIVTGIDADGPDNTNDTADDNAPIYGLVNVSVTDAQKYADHVYVRLYEDKLIDVVIVKGAPIAVE